MPASSKKRKILDSEDEESVSSEPSFNDDESMSFDDDDSDAKPQKKKAKSPTKPKAVKETAKSKSPKKQQEPKESKVSAKSEPPPQTMPTSSSSGPSSSGADITQGPPVSTDAAAKKLVLMYMKQQNRPYSLLQIFENLHKRIPKPTLERVLNTMSGPGGELLCKEYSKTKIYYLDQTALSASFPIKQFDSLQEENQILAEELDDLKNKTKQLQAALNQITSEPADNEVDSVLQQTTDRVTAKQGEIRRLQQKITEDPDPNALSKAVKRHNELRQAWFRRKSMCVDAVDLLAEGMGKKTKQMISELGLETDEEAGQALPAAIKPKEPAAGSFRR